MTDPEVDIVILCDWPVVTAGLEAICASRQTRSLSTRQELLDLMDASDVAPRVVVADPRLLDAPSLSRLRSAGVKLVALQLHLMPASVSDAYDTSISIVESRAAISARLKDLLAAAAQKPDKEVAELSPREKEVVCGLVKGLANKEIAAEMCVSVNTVMTHRRNIAAKLHLHSAAALTIYALAKGLVALDEVRASLDL